MPENQETSKSSLTPEAAAEIQRLLRRRRTWLWVVFAGIGLTVFGFVCHPAVSRDPAWRVASSAQSGVPCAAPNEPATAAPGSAVVNLPGAAVGRPAEVTHGAPDRWIEIRSWKGRSDKRTDNFHVSASRARIAWEAMAGEYGVLLIINLYAAGTDDLVSRFAGADGPDADTGYFSGPGDFYMEIGCANGRYSVAVQERRPEIAACHLCKSDRLPDHPELQAPNHPAGPNDTT